MAVVLGIVGSCQSPRTSPATQSPEASVTRSLPPVTGTVVGLDGTGDSPEISVATSKIKLVQAVLDRSTAHVTVQLETDSSYDKVVSVSVISDGDAKSLRGGKLSPTIVYARTREPWIFFCGPITLHDESELYGTVDFRTDKLPSR
jgi:hypothetical protein